MIKNILRSGFAVLLVMILVSWGYDGHRAVGEIAENHLTPTAKATVKKMLLGGTMSEAANFADDIKGMGEYRYTAVLHYINIPAGFNFEQFSAFIKTDATQNIYSGIGSCIKDLQDPNKTELQKNFALKLLIHFVGDAHQPMHISREEDRGGGRTVVKFLGQNTDLHTLWDDGIFFQKKLHYKEIALKFDDATPQQIAKWQNDNVMIWLWESYQVSTILYQEAKDNPDFNEKYYEDHLPILKSRIEKAGIRLAGVLNDIYK